MVARLSVASFRFPKITIPTWAKSPVFLAAFFLALLFYTKTLVLKDNSIRSLVPFGSVRFIEGEVYDNPVAVDFDGEKRYRAIFRVFKTENGDGLSSSARGECVVFLPAEKVESLFPNGLWTQAGKSAGLLVEEGARLRLSVSPFGKNTFFASEILPSKKGVWKKGFLGFISKIRAKTRLQLRFLMKNWGEAGSLVLALLSADRSFLPSSVSRAFRRAGLSHVLALSGMHLTIFGSLAFSFGKKTVGKKGASLFRVFFVGAFVWFAGLSPSLVRALLCVCIYEFSSFLSLRRPHEITVLSAAFLIHLSLFPSHLFHAAFLLSYAALLGIFVLAPVFDFLFCRVFPRFVSKSLAASSGAFFATLPISLSLFGQVYPIGIIASPIISPLVEIFMKIAIFAILFSLALPFLLEPFGCIMGALYEVLKGIATFFAAFHGV